MSFNKLRAGELQHFITPCKSVNLDGSKRKVHLEGIPRKHSMLITYLCCVFYMYKTGNGRNPYVVYMNSTRLFYLDDVNLIHKKRFVFCFPLRYKLLHRFAHGLCFEFLYVQFIRPKSCVSNKS